MTAAAPDLLAHLKKTLSPARYRHTLAVARWAEDLARLHGEDPARARRAGLLHDVAKEMPGPALARYVRAHRVPVPGSAEIDRRKAHALFHAHVSAHRAAREWGKRTGAS
ncbi:MAG: HD domain-containing protein [Elusimicrobia bacterium]|nr:HD domain-containing protein [Elusimicrobiota bacterium]